MSRGQLVPDDTIVRVFLDRLEAADAVEGAILDGFPRTRVQAEALDAALAEAGRRVDAARYIDVPIEDLVQRMANRRICTANGHVYNLASNPPQVGDLRPRRLSRRSSSRPTTRATVRARMSQQVPPLLEVVDHYRSQGVLRTVDGRQDIDGRHPTPSPPLAHGTGRPEMVTRKSRAEIRRIRQAGQVVAESSPASRRS